MEREPLKGGLFKPYSFKSRGFKGPLGDLEGLNSILDTVKWLKGALIEDITVIKVILSA